MAKELAFVLINPYSIRKSRTGGIIARYLVRTDLRLVGARLFGPSQALAEEYARHVRFCGTDSPGMSELIADYLLLNYSPNAASGRSHRTMCLLFEGEDAVTKIRDVTGGMRLTWGSGLTVRDTYGDFVEDPDGCVRYFEPAVLVAWTLEQAAETLRLWRRYLPQDSGIIRGALDVPGGENVEQTLVMLKPDNFRFPSIRAGNIVDLLSSSGLRMVGIKKFAMSVAQAERFYEPVRASLLDVFPSFARGRAAQALSREFGFPVDESQVEALCRDLAPRFSERQFEDIVEFMTGRRPATCEDAERRAPGREVCLAIVYEGLGAVAKIRDLLGSTDPSKARPGSVRREFGTSIMINAAHASDSPENARREMEILDLDSDMQFEQIIEDYYGV